MNLKRIVLASVLAASLAFGAYSCFGKFAATKAIYNFNERISGNGVVQSVVMVGMIIIPVYALASLGDVLIFNVIEFWTGSNPLGGGGATAEFEIEQDESGVATFRRGAEIYQLRPIDAERFAVYLNDQPVGFAQIDSDSSLVLYDNEGRTIQTVSSNDFEAIQSEIGEIAQSL